MPERIASRAPICILLKAGDFVSRVNVFYKDYKNEFTIISIVVAALGIALVFEDWFLGGAMILEGVLLALFYAYFAPKNDFSMLALPCFIMAAYQLGAALLMIAESGFESALLIVFMFLHAASLIMTSLLVLKVYDIRSIGGIVTQIFMLIMIALGIWWLIDGVWVLINTDYRFIEYLIYYIPYAAMLILPALLNIVYLRCFVSFKRNVRE